MFKTPSGIPLRLANSANASAVKGVASAGFSTTYTKESAWASSNLALIDDCIFACTPIWFLFYKARFLAVYVHGGWDLGDVRRYVFICEGVSFLRHLEPQWTMLSVLLSECFLGPEQWSLVNQIYIAPCLSQTSVSHVLLNGDKCRRKCEEGGIHRAACCYSWSNFPCNHTARQESALQVMQSAKMSDRSFKSLIKLIAVQKHQGCLPPSIKHFLSWCWRFDAQGAW